jgi:hypothetical protein
LLCRQSRRGGAAAVLLCAALVTAGFAGGSDPDVKLAVVKHKEFLKILAKEKGKVVVLDVWGEF